MNTKQLPGSPGPVVEMENRKQSGVGRMAWAYLPVMLALSGVVLVLFGFSWWTALLVVLLLACPAAIAVAVRVGSRPLPGSEGPCSTRSNLLP
jgi:hypothetical protein